MSCDLDHLNKLSFPHPKEAPHKFWLQSALWLLRKRSLKMSNLRDLDQGQPMTMTFGIPKNSCTHLVDCIYQRWHHRPQ